MLRNAVCVLLVAISFSLTAGEKPNVIVVLADDIGVGDISFYRSMHSDQIILETPNIDALAKQGMAFTQAHAPAALCAPSRYAIMSGNSCYRSSFPWGVWGPYEKSPIKPDQLTLGKLMKQAGYQTAFLGKWHLGGDYLRKDDPTVIYRGPRNKPELDVDITRIIEGPMEKGFDYSLTFPAGIQNVPYAVYENQEWMPLKEDSEIGYISQENMSKIGVKLDKSEGLGDLNWDPHDMGPLLVNKAVDYINKHANQEDPFFIYYCSQAVHLPHTPPEELNGIKIAGTTPSRHMDMIKELDVQMGMLVETLKAQGIYENTLIIFTSDNGGLLRKETLNSGHKPSDIYRGGKNTAFEGGHRVPFFASWPGTIEPDQLSGEPVLGLDIMGTLAELTGQQIPDNQAMDTYSLMPMLLNKDQAMGHAHLMLQAGTGKEVILIRDGWKLIMQVDKKDKSDRIRIPIALYDLNDNPQEEESKNLIASKEHQELVMEMFAMYNTLRDQDSQVISMSLEKEKEAIKAVIEEEKNAFYDQDLDRIKATMVNDSSTRKLIMRKDGFDETVGIEANLEGNREAFGREMGDDIKWTSEYYNYTIQVYGNTALVYHDSKHTSTDPSGATVTTMRRMVHLLKVDGKWKMDLMALFMDQ